MANSLGYKLRQARLRKNITIEEAAHATKIRTGRIEDLERDDYSNFANLSYAKGFLAIYAKYLGIDIASYLEQFDDPRLRAGEEFDLIYDRPPVLTYHSPELTQPKRKSRKPVFYILAIGAVGIVLL